MKSDLLQDAVVKNVLSGPASLCTDGNSVYLTKLQLRGLNGGTAQDIFRKQAS